MTQPCFVPERVLADLGGNVAALGDMVDAYLADLDAAVLAITEASRAGDLAVLARQVHQLLGSFAVLQVESARLLARELEQRLAGRQPPPPRHVAGLIEAAHRLADELRAWRGANPIRYNDDC
jgi:HPt (histidine-containing phosphotransfer) domain-containing protein